LLVLSAVAQRKLDAHQNSVCGQNATNELSVKTA